MDYNHCRPHSSLSYLTPAGFAQRCREAACIRPHTSVPDGVQDCGILSETLDPKRGADQETRVATQGRWRNGLAAFFGMQR